MKIWKSFALVVLLLLPTRARALDESQLEKLETLVLPRQLIDVSKMGVNAFVNDGRFGGISGQFKEVQSTLGIRYVRVLFAWNDQVQPTPTSSPDWSFYDDIAKKIPSGVEALVIINGVPSWMADSRNWIEGNPRKTFVELWLKKVVKRYKKKTRIIGWEVWNEPNWDAETGNTVLQLLESPENYVELLAYANNVIRQQTPKKKIVIAATTAIGQNFPETLDYNKRMKAAGAESFGDIWAVHFYGRSLWRLPWIADFLNQVQRPIWITESGAKGVNNQRSYIEQVWPVLKTFIPGISRFYFYQFTESTPAEQTYGLKNLTPGFTVSDLYIYLRDQQAAAKKKKSKKE